jgi:hypothetical protein
MVADNNLEEASLKDMMEIESARFPAQARILLEVDRWAAPEGSDDPFPLIFDWNTTKRFQLTRSGLSELEDLGEMNMGDSETLRDFLSWGLDYAPAEHFALIMWDHGGGWIGFGQNMSHSGDKLNLQEMEDAISGGLGDAGASRLDLLGFDACLMSTMETALQLQGVAEVMVASEETEPGSGWDYEVITNFVGERPSATSVEFGQAIADGYQRHIERLDPVQLPGITLSVINLRSMSALSAAFDDFSSALDENLTNRTLWLQIANARNSVDRYNRIDGNLSGEPHLIDLGHFADLVGSRIGGIVSDTADELLRVLDSSVLYQVAGASQENAHGLAVYFPPTYDLASPHEVLYLSVSSASWQSFLNNYLTFVDTDITPPTVGTVSVVRGLTSAVISATVTADDDIMQASFMVLLAFSGGHALLGTDQVAVAGGVMTYRWDYEVPLLFDGRTSVPISLFPSGSYTDGGVAYTDFVAFATYHDPATIDFIPVILYYRRTGSSDYEFVGAYSNTSGVVSEVYLRTGGLLNSIVWIVTEAGGEFLEMSEFSLDIGVEPPVLQSHLADVADYLVGFSVSDYSGNYGGAFAPDPLRPPCSESYQCNLLAGRPACETATGECVECFSTCATCCELGQTCRDHHCCTPDCSGRECGSDGCGGSCGPGCTMWETCVDETGECVPTPGCSGECDLLRYTTCTCHPSDPCGWANDWGCDAGCLEVEGVDAMFDDSADCECVGGLCHITLEITDSCLDGLGVNYRFYDVSNSLVWPAASSYYHTELEGIAYSSRLSCWEGATVCYGAATGETSWGVGLDNTLWCPDCCVICSGGLLYRWNLGC